MYTVQDGQLIYTRGKKNPSIIWRNIYQRAVSEANNIKSIYNPDTINIEVGAKLISLGEAEFQKEKEIIQCEVLKRIIWNIGGKKYATPISSEVLQEIMSKKINTIGRCLIKLKKDKLYVFRENRNIPHIIPKGTSFKWDNRFLINLNTELSDCIVQSTRPSEDLNIPREACIGYPCLYRRSDNSIHDRKNYDIVFMNKVNLFDIFV